VAARNPEVIYVSIAGFGHAGPFAQRRVYDPLIQAASGMAWAQGQGPGQDGAPRLVRSIVCDKVTALFASQAICAALFARAQGRGGQHVRLSMLDAALAFHWADMMWNHTLIGDGPGEVVRTAELADMFRLYRSRDGWVIVVSSDDATFRGLCAAFGRPEMCADPRFATLLLRMQHIAELLQFTEGEIGRRTSDEVCALLDHHGVPCAKVNEIGALPLDPQIAHNQSLVEVDHPVAGRLRQPAPPIDFARTPAAVSGPAPRHGEHTDQVLREQLGLDDARIADLRVRQVIL
jgi:crotonobetainyl-CoA:carnitine CoA-transferase CaiB-like acyl-CoA transferase